MSGKNICLARVNINSLNKSTLGPFIQDQTLELTSVLHMNIYNIERTSISEHNNRVDQYCAIFSVA